MLSYLSNLQRRGLLTPQICRGVWHYWRTDEQQELEGCNLALLFILFLDFFDELVLLLRIFEDAVIVVAGAEDVYDHE